MSQANAHRRLANRTQGRHELGRRVADLLAGAWRAARQTENRGPRAGSPRGVAVPVPNLSEAELTEILPALCESGAGALAWNKIRNSPLATTAPGSQLHEVYRRFRLSALLHEREIAYVFSLLRAEGIDAVLVKGWAIARRYPDSALRPYGDIDLCIRPDHFEKASRALKCLEDIDGHYADLHSGFGEVGRSGRVQSPTSNVQSPSALRRLWTLNFGVWTKRGDWDEPFARSHVVECAGEPVRILCDEDHLRLLCSHLLRSGARRPPWLCDVALLLEASPTSNVQEASPMSNVQSPKSSLGKQTLDLGPWTLDSNKPFDWNLCFGANPVHANWIGSVVGLAHELLGVDISKTPFAGKQLPGWLAPAVLKQWAGRPVQSSTSNVQSPLGVRRLWTLDLGLWTRFNNPVRATAAVGGQFNNWPRLPYRVAELVTRLPEVPQQLQSLAVQFAARQVKPSRRVAAV